MDELLSYSELLWSTLSLECSADILLFVYYLLNSASFECLKNGQRHAIRLERLKQIGLISLLNHNRTQL